MSDQSMRPLPQPTALSAMHWEGALEERLMVQKCGDCQTFVFTPKRACPHCFSANLSWTQSSGRGTIYSYTVIHRAPHPAFQVPYCAAVVELEEGWHMLTNIVGTPMDAIAVGAPVEVSFETFGKIALPCFRVVGAAPAH